MMGELPAAQIREAGQPSAAARDVFVIGAGEQYCRTLSIRVLRGRDLEIADRGRTPIPVIVNWTLSQMLFPDASPLGRHLLMGKQKEEVLEVVGVAADARMRTLGEGNKPALFKPDFNSQLLVSVGYG